MAPQDSPDAITPVGEKRQYASSMKDSATEDAEQGEVFKQTKDGVNFRTLGWPWASVIFLKSMRRPE